MTGLAEIRETDATADIATIYGQIKEASGLPLVNLIWRHFAALPGVLPWAWAAVEPLIRSTSMAQARGRLAAGIALPTPAGFDWREAGLDPGETARVRAIIVAYTRGNLTNLLALTALRLRLEQPQAPAGVLLPGGAAATGAGGARPAVRHHQSAARCGGHSSGPGGPSWWTGRHHPQPLPAFRALARLAARAAAWPRRALRAG